MRALHGICIHYTATPEGRPVTVKEVDKWHKQRGWSGIGYHYLIYADGSIHAGRPLSETGAHVAGHNTGTIGICYVGGLRNGKSADTRTAAQKIAIRGLCVRLLRQYPSIKWIKGHRDLGATLCPGFNAIPEYSALLNNTGQPTTKRGGCGWLKTIMSGGGDPSQNER